ncbi:cell division protein FtsX [Desulfitibacter alkalitolerans]|uniref:cell division protein FtsX n=1 Tax=Desulfitibacter alkalitolerans TaxID=264641 RepID=UPI00047F5319|nr:permease-like cell division protein FtsX [Desulfitibacter alkalitolerans]
MKYLMRNWDYFLKEVKTSIGLNLIPSFFSFICIGLIFFILGIIVSGWWISSNVVEAVQREAEINVFYNDSLGEPEAAQLVQSIGKISGVRQARIVNEQEAYNRMVSILGSEAHVLEVFEDNPFSTFIEVNIELGKTNEVLEGISQLPDIEYIRDNKEVLSQLEQIVKVLSLIGYLGIITVSTATLIITSHIIRLGIYSRKEQINTLRLLGAPEGFIALPFLLEGLLLSASGGILAFILTGWSLNLIYAQIYGSLAFIPLPLVNDLIIKLGMLIIGLSIAFGLSGSFIGLFSARKSV